MPLPWPAISNVGGDLPEQTQKEIQQLLDRWADRVIQLMTAYGLTPPASPLFRPWNLVVVLDAEKIIAAFSPLQGGVALMRWVDLSAQIVPPEAIVNDIQAQLGMPVSTAVTLPRAALEGIQVETSIEAAAQQHFTDVERVNRLARLGDISGLAHLEPFLRAFLEDHPDPTKNVFVMMRFLETEQMRGVDEAIRRALRERDFHPVRADDRDYTGELWTNIEVCMTGCHLGIAVFEDIEQREFNPNVSLELGYMLGKRRRCLILKERRLPELPTDVIHRLYKPFDMFNIDNTVRAQVLRWIDVDLGGL